MQARILVVDDEKFIVEAISQHLTQLGHDVRTYLDPTEALLAIKSEPIDLVLTDLRMPDVSGMDITRAVYDRGEDTRVVILTGYATLDSAIESVHLQVYAYLNKPFDLRQLGQVVERALNEQRLERENKELTEKISNMLSDITTLYEVTRLIYDTDDFDMTLEFVLDTLSIGLGISHSVLITRTSSGEYSIAKANMPENSKIAGILDKVPWADLEKVVPGPESATFGLDGKPQSVLKALNAGGEELRAMVVTPVWYREALYGYLIVLQVGDMGKFSADQETLLGILATQIAPQIYQASDGTVDAPTRGYLARSHNILRERIKQAIHGKEEKFAITLVRLGTDRVWSNLNQLEEFQTAVEKLVKSHQKDAELHWLGGDTAMILFPNLTQIEAEVTCMAIDTDYVRGEAVLPPTDMLEEGAGMTFASTVWPHDGDEAGPLLTLTWFRLMSEIQREEIRLGEVTSEDE